MIRAAGPDDQLQIAAFLLRHIDIAMFPVSNLRTHGLADGDFASSHPHAMRIWIIGPGLRGIVALTRQGMLMAVLPDHPDLAGLAPLMAGMMVTGAVGPAAHMRRLLGVLDLSGRPTRHDADEPGFTLDLSRLQIPLDAGARLITPGAAERELMIAWRVEYHHQVLGTRDPQAQAIVDIDGYLARDSHRVLKVGAQPVAMTGFNANLPEIVQVGGVFTPVALRNRGYARLAVALHLQEARNCGVRRAVLFAAGPAAVRAYQAIGFQPGSPMALILFADMQKVTG